MPIDAPTTSIPIVSPPPRRSASPDRPMRANGAGVATRDDHAERFEEEDRPRSRTGTWVALVLLLVLAVVGGYFAASRTALPIPFLGRTVTLDNYVGESSAQAQQALLTLGITPKITQVQSETTAPDRVVRQTPDAGATVSSNDQVELFVSNGPPMVGIPDVRTFSRQDAVRVLAQAKLMAKIQPRFGDQPLDTVVDVKPDPQTQVHEGSIITLFVSEGKPPVAVPNVVSMSVDDATAALNKLGLKLVVGEHQASTNIPENMIAAQDPKDGSKLAPGSAVNVVVSAGADLVTVPDVGGKSVRDAVSAVTGAGFEPVFSFTVQGGTPGVVLAQIPAANAQAKRGSGVTITVAATGTVPDVSTMSLDDAKTALQNDGYVVGNVALTQDGQEGKVVRTEPAAGTQLHPGETVVIYYNQPGQAH
jgi:serine/threonine-protein kinase